MKLVMISSAAIFAAGTAFAGGYTPPVTEPAVTPIVSAPVAAPVADWTGFYAGLQYGQGNAEVSSDAGSADQDFDAYGVHGGYLHDMGRYVVGAELDYNKLNFDNDGGDADLTRLKGRAGMKFGNFLPYLTAGYAHVSTDEDNGDLSEGGVVYGIGADYLINDKFSVGAEYTRHNFSDVGDVDGLDLDANLVQVRAAYHF